MSKPPRTPVTNKAPAFNQGIKPTDPQQMLAEATPEQVRALMADSFALWAAYSGIEVDNHKFEFDKHRYLLPIYLDNSQELTLIKAAQMGATVYQLLFLLWWARHKSVKCGMYFPTADGVAKLSKDRLGPLLRSSKELEDAVVSDGDTLGLKQIRNIEGKISSIYMLYMGGQASKDSVPLDVVLFDEVRLIDPNDIDQAIHRTSHSEYKVKRFMSTAGIPNDDIDARYQRGTQLVWHSKCNCPDGVCLADVFPDCIVDTGTEVYYRCPRCGMRIHDPQIGAYVAHNPGAEFPSYSISQLISKFRTPKEIWTEYNQTTNKKEFYNAALGKPYVDKDNQPVTLDTMLACVRPDVRWAKLASKKANRRCAMGVDQMGGYNYVVVAERDENNKKRIVHLEVIESSNPDYFGEKGEQVTPFKRLYQMMSEFDVGLCVVDWMPNYNEAADFARAFPARVFLAYYGDAGQDMVKWNDKLKTPERLRKGSKEIKLKYSLVINRYMGIDYALQEFVEGNVDVPHPDALIQTVRNESNGRLEPEAICRTRFFRMMCSAVRQRTEIDKDTDRYKMEWTYTQGDPHFLHAWVYCNIALERLKRTVLWSLG